ncbi:MAG: zf-HC2 domain-containing protein [Pyrinomonadaceae bacterium]
MAIEPYTIACPTDEISAYIDGELSGELELELEMHFAECGSCAKELNLQKQFLCGLNSSLKQDDALALPADFTRHIVANAESTVAGLRRPREIYNAVFICVALLLFGLFALGADAARVYEMAATAVDQVGAVGGFFARVVYSLFLGIAIILRSIAAQFPIGENVAAAVSAIAGIVLLMYVSRKVLRTHRA